MGQALVFGLIGSSALVIGGAIGAYWRAPHQISGVLLAFASGTLISALAFELFPEAVHLGGLWPAGLGLIAGGLTFVVINTALDSWVAQSAGDPHEPIENPGYAKLAAMAKAMGFAPELWFEQGATRVPDGRSDDSRGIAGRVEYLFDALRNPKTGKPYTNAEVARMMLGDLSKEDIEGNRGGAIGDPSVGQIRALAGVFGVEPCKLIKALPDGTLREAAVEISLSVRARQATGVGDRAAVQNAGRCYRSIDL